MSLFLRRNPNLLERVQEDVRVLGVIGEGAFGEVSLASATVFGKIAIKWLKVNSDLHFHLLIYGHQ